MSPLLFILKRSFMNTVKGLVKKPGTLIAYIVIAAFFLIGPIIVALNPNESISPMAHDTAKAILVAYTIFILYISVASSIAGGNSFFRLADVNLLFTAPIKAGNILVYGFVKQMVINIMIMAFLALHYPNWKRMFGFIDGAGVILAVAYVILLMLSSVSGIVVYSFVSKSQQRKKTVKTALTGGLVLFLLSILINGLETGNLLKSAVSYLSCENLKYIPVLGWLREILMGTLYGFSAGVALNTLYLVVVTVALFIYVYRTDTGFYEDVLTGTELRETMVKASREGKTVSVYGKYRKYKTIDHEFTAEGSKVLLQRQLLEMRKTGIGIISKRTLLLLAGGIIASLAIDADGNILLAILLGISVYIMMIFNMITTWEGDLSKHYIYLIPASAASKMIYSTIPNILQLFIEGVIVFTAAGVLAGSSALPMVTAIIAYTMIGSAFTYSDLFIRRLFGRIHGKILRVFFRIFLVFIILVPSVIATSVIIATTGNFTLGFLATALVSLVLTALFMITGIGLFNRPEYD